MKTKRSKAKRNRIQKLKQNKTMWQNFPQHAHTVRIMLNFSTWKTFQSEKQHRGKAEVWTAAAANVYYHFKTNRVLTWLFGTLHIRSFSHSFRHHFESENVHEWVRKSTVPAKIKPIKANIGFALPPQKWHCRLSPSHLLLLLCSEVKRTPLMCLVSCRVVCDLLPSFFFPLQIH